uniref:Alanine transaminase n=1 Tax=Panagrolaimus sp. JU765 TaxID=591449 RepID=A0AC34R714_9BILA
MQKFPFSLLWSVNRHSFLTSTLIQTVRMASTKHVLTVDTINPNVVTMQYAVRGPLVIRAVELEKELAQGAQKPFKNVIKANIGDAHAMGQKPITFIRQVLGCVSYPKLLESSELPADVKEHARDILASCGGQSTGAYSQSSGIEVIRKHVAEYIERRDGIPTDPENVILSGGASESIRNVLKMFINRDSNKKAGIMIPIPQYPLYSASIEEFNLGQIGYYLDESKNWGLDQAELNRSYEENKDKFDIKAIVVINPGNPTGQVLTKENIQSIIKFAQEKNLFILADEVYQDNVYAPGSAFHSFKKVLVDMGEPYSKLELASFMSISKGYMGECGLRGDNVYAPGSAFHSFKKVLVDMGEPYSKLELASFMSISKGYMGECGLRGGYVEFMNLDPQVYALFKKMTSAKLCSTTLGQAGLDCVVRPPKKGDPSYDLWLSEKTAVLDSLKERAILVQKAYDALDGITCNTVQGAMYAFPRLHLPKKAVEKAKSLGQEPDFFYAMNLLESTGVCIVPGSGFGQRDGTYHFRTTILPQSELMKDMLNRFTKFHESFMKQYS